MKREIKFRMWDVDNKIFIDSWWVQFGHNTIRLITDVGCHFDIVNCHEDDKNKYIVQQFTRLKDKNDTDIFEGDIINYTPFNQLDYKNIQATVPDLGRFHWFQDLHDMLSEENKCDIEVIGNVFEPPNLIKK